MNAAAVPLPPGEWRRRAEARLAGEPGAGELDAPRLVHELRVHQIELELQNEALREAQVEAETGWQRARELYDFAPVSYFTVDAQGLIQELNLAAASLLGQERGALVRRRFALFLCPGDRVLFSRFLAAALSEAGSPPCEVSLDAQGGPRRVRLEGSATADGSALRMAAVDITELRLNQEQVAVLNQELEWRVTTRTAQLKAANADLESFCYMISHELRGPLARIEGFSRMLLSLLPGGEPEQIGHVARRLDASSGAARIVVDSLLKLTRLALDPIEVGALDLADLARQVLADLSREGQPVPARLIVPKRLPVRGDRRLLEIALRNLLANAVKFSSATADAQVELGQSLREGQVVYFVRDNGAGFDPAQSAKMFQPFVRLHRQSDFPGTGIGLTLVHRVIEKHGGSIWAESAPGAGATFYFTLG